MPATCDLIIRLGKRHNKWVIVLHDYDGTPYVSDCLLAAIRRQLDKRYDGNGVKEFDHVEILGTDDARD